MKTFSTPITNEIAAVQSGWGEFYDIYLKSAIVTPWGTISTLRLTDTPGLVAGVAGMSFFTPGFYPEPEGTQEDAATYRYWPIKRETSKSADRSQNDKMTVAASNVTTEFAAMLSLVEWRGSPIVIRKVAHSIASPTASDYIVVFSGVIDSLQVDEKQIAFSCSNDLGGFNLMLPRENMHATCRFDWADDMCTAIKYAVANYYKGTVDGACSATSVADSGITQDTATDSSLPNQDLVDAVANNSQITTSSQETGYEGYMVRASYFSGSSCWKFNTSGDWGTNLHGLWYIPDAQSGLKNPALKPYWQIDLVNAAQAGLWRISSSKDEGRDSLVRLVLFFSSSNGTDWTFQRYFEMPPLPDTLFDVNIPNAPTARYWRICVRTRWGETLKKFMFRQIFAYGFTRNYWLDGTITFDSDTDTAALQGVSRRIKFSHAGKVYCGTLPATPQTGDTFVLQRGCNKSFNACAERLNTENFGGFDSMPFEMIVR